MFGNGNKKELTTITRILKDIQLTLNMDFESFVDSANIIAHKGRRTIETSFEMNKDIRKEINNFRETINNYIVLFDYSLEEHKQNMNALEKVEQLLKEIDNKNERIIELEHNFKIQELKFKANYLELKEELMQKYAIKMDIFNKELEKKNSIIARKDKQIGKLKWK